MYTLQKFSVETHARLELVGKPEQHKGRKYAVLISLLTNGAMGPQFTDADGTCAFNGVM